jgi:hypothetical protein
MFKRYTCAPATNLPKQGAKGRINVRPSAAYTAAFMGASRKKIATSDGSNVIFTKYIGHSENMS